MTTLTEKRAAFRALHADGCFLLPNPWDAGSARMLQHLGFKALASTSSGFAWTQGRTDYDVRREDVLAHLAQLNRAVDLPINADFESGFAETPEEVGVSVRLAIEAGVAGLSIEDRNLQKGGALYDRAMALERLCAARHAIDASGADVILVARTEILLDDPTQVTQAIDSLVAFAGMGADCLYAPGARKPEDIRAMVKALAPKPVNVLAIDPAAMTLAGIADLGVRRISVGGALARVAWAGAMAAAKGMLGGSFAALAAGTSGRELNAIFARKEAR